ncbi:Fc.00g070250.m01.CDS01 [Cosmosporella sp. VM-42]
MALLTLLRAFRLPYPDYDEGFWGEPTSTLNFCEEDYALSFYCAELCNTVTNVLFVWLGLKGIRNCLKYSHPGIFVIAFVGYIVVGLGSTFFHASLKYPMQLVDELSMIYTTCLMVYASFSYSRSRTFSVVLGVNLLGLAGFITLYYHVTKNPAFHQAAYAALTATVVFRSMWVMESQLRPALEARNQAKSRKTLKTMWKIVATGEAGVSSNEAAIDEVPGLLVFLGGWFIWNLDIHFCSQVRRWRRAIGLPWAVLLEGHAWWHLMTGLAYYYIVWGIWLRHCLDGQSDEYVLHWPRLVTSIPEVRRIQQQGKKQE